MKNYFITDSGKKVCPVCGKEFYPADCELYAYKMPVSIDGRSQLYYFCRYNHLRLYEKEYEERKQKTRFENSKKQQAKKRERRKNLFFSEGTKTCTKNL